MTTDVHPHRLSSCHACQDSRARQPYDRTEGCKIRAIQMDAKIACGLRVWKRLNFGQLGGLREPRLRVSKERKTSIFLFACPIHCSSNRMPCFPGCGNSKSDQDSNMLTGMSAHPWRIGAPHQQEVRWKRLITDAIDQVPNKTGPNPPSGLKKGESGLWPEFPLCEPGCLIRQPAFLYGVQAPVMWRIEPCPLPSF
jgi:hypothetical protein